ncbi:MAG: hypothetical protein O7E52_21730 [Candidatus Poribacteria bacterium]|nr:hypothetical protein [Candidatus Poribacteria bacterium]
MKLETLNTKMKFAAIFGLVFALALSAAWAKTYYTSKTVRDWGRWIPISFTRGKSCHAVILPGAISQYLDEQGLDAVEITVEMIEVDGALVFTFGPSGAHFDPPLQLVLSGDYLNDNDEMLLFNEYGEALEYESFFDGRVLTFKIPHFSSYYYDNYDY